MMEGTSFNVCCPRTGKFSKYEQISVMVNGRSSKKNMQSCQNSGSMHAWFFVQ